jgi:putative chitinase
MATTSQALVTAAQLRRLCPGMLEPRAQLFAGVLDDAFQQFEISTPRRVRHFFGQALVETGNLRGLVESLAYQDAKRLDDLFLNVQGIEHAQRLIKAGAEAIGNTIYANKNGNGGINSGDGYRYRGRGFLQVTGRANYREVGRIVSLPLEDQPDLLGEPEPAAMSAAAFWRDRKINAPADADDVSTVTLLVNGKARLHLKERTEALQRAKAIWPD